MIFNPTEKQVPCPLCGIDIDLETRKYGLNRPVVEKCPWCAGLLRITKILRIKPKEKRDLDFRLAACYEQHRPRRKTENV